MAELLARGQITIAVVNDGYNLSLSAASVSITANHDGSNPDLSCANTLVTIQKGGENLPFDITNIVPSADGIRYAYESAGTAAWKVSITGLDSYISTGYLDIIVRTKDNYQTSVRFGFAVVRNTAGLEWIEEWDGTHNQIGENYVITPKLFAGHKTEEGKITGVYLGKLKGFIGEVFPFTLSDPEEGIYGYRDNKIVFFIDNNGAKIGGWEITPGSIQCEDGTLTIKSEGSISSQTEGVTHWSLNKDGSALFANGKVTMDAKGNASFEGHIKAASGEIAGWNIGKDSIYKTGVAMNSSKRFIAVANVITDELEGDHLDWVKLYGGVAMYYVSSADYGIIAYKGDKKVFSAGSSNYFAGWNFDEDAIWLGTKNNNAGQFTNDASSITMGTNGIRGYKFRLDKNGAGAIAGGNISWDETGKVTFSKEVSLAWSVGIDDTAKLAASASKEATEAKNAANNANQQYTKLLGSQLTYIGETGLYTGTVAADKITAGTISTANIKQVNNRWYLNQDGSGSLANGSIWWDEEGNVTFSDKVILTWKDVLSIGSYSVSMTAPSVVIPVDSNGENPDLSNANTSITIYNGKAVVPFDVINVIPSHDGISCAYENSGDAWKITILNVKGDVQSGFLTVALRTYDNVDMTVRFSFALVKGPKEMAFLEEWEGTYTQIGSNYVVTPRIFAGTKTSSGKLTGVYLGKLSGYLGQTLPFTFSEAEAGIYGYKDNTIVFSIDNNGAMIAGWKIDYDSLYLGTKKNTSGVYTTASGDITMGTTGIRGYKWFLNSDGSGALAGGNIKWDSSGNVTFGSNVVLQWQNEIDKVKKEALSEAEKAELAAKELASAMAFGKMLYRNPTFLSVTDAKGNDLSYNGVKVYNNKSNSNVTVTRQSSSSVPNDSGYMLTIKNIGTSTPGCGGFSFQTQTGYRKIFITRIIAKIPTGRKIQFASNSIGTGGTSEWLTPIDGTGDWCEYIIKVRCGTANFSSTNFFFIDGAVGTSSSPVTWYIAYATVFDVTTSERYTTTIDANGIYTSTLNANQIVAGTIDADRIAAKSITTDKIAIGAIDSDQLADGAVGTDQLAGGAVTAAELATNAVIGTKIKDGVITTAKIAANAITAGKIAAHAITTEKIAAGAVTATEIEIGAVGTDQLAGGAVTAAELASSAVTTVKIKDGAITAAKITAGAITTEKLAAESVTAAKIKTGTITADQIAANTITAAEIKSGAITTDKLAANAITATMINGLSCTFTKGLIGGLTIASASLSNTSIVTEHVAGSPTKQTMTLDTTGLDIRVRGDVYGFVKLGLQYIYLYDNDYYCSIDITHGIGSLYGSYNMCGIKMSLRSKDLGIYINGGSNHILSSGVTTIHGLVLNQRWVSVSCTLDVNDDIVMFNNTSADIVITLPGAAPVGKIYYFKKTGSKKVTLSGYIRAQNSTSYSSTTKEISDISYMAIKTDVAYTLFYCG